ncbi:MAG: helix-hairpin-helix domain-containing protein [Bacteroidota bacterium]
MAVILFSEPVYRHWQSGNKPDYSKDQQYLDSLVATLSFIKADSVIEKENPEPAGIKFYPFDPNTLAEDKLAQLGLPAFLVKRIARYREKGGSFRKKEDVAKIYGMDSAWYRKAEPWITIAPISAKEITARAYEKKIVDIEVIDINIADSTS